MKKIKKALLLAMSFVMTTAMFAACGLKSDESSKDSTPPAASSVEQPESSVEETPGESEEPATSEEPGTSEEPTTSEEPATSEEPGTSEEPTTSEEPEVVTYTLTLVNGNSTETVEYEAGDMIDYPALEDSVGKTFDGWFKVDENGELTEAPMFMPEGDITVQAKWTLETKTVTVTKLNDEVVTYTIAVEAVEAESIYAYTSMAAILEEAKTPAQASNYEVYYEGMPEVWELADYTLTEVEVKVDDADVTSSMIFLDRVNKYLLQPDGTIKENKDNYWDGATDIVTVENQTEVTAGGDSTYAVKVSFDPSLLTAEQCAAADAAWAGWSTATTRQTWAAFAIPVDGLNLNLTNVTFDMKVDNMNTRLVVYGVKVAEDGAEYVYEVGVNYTLSPVVPDSGKDDGGRRANDGWQSYQLLAANVHDSLAASQAADYFVFSLDNTQAGYDNTKASVAYIDNVVFTDVSDEHTHVYEGEYGRDENGHWQSCYCGDVKVSGHGSSTTGDAEHHWSVCTACGYVGESKPHNPDLFEYFPNLDNTHSLVAGCCGTTIGEPEACHGEWQTVGEEILSNLRDAKICEACGNEYEKFYLQNIPGLGWAETVTTLNLNLEKAGEASTVTFNLAEVLSQFILSQQATGFEGLYFKGELVMSAEELFANIEAIPASIFGYAWGEQELEFVVYTGTAAEEDEGDSRMRRAGDLARHAITIKFNLITNIIETKEELDNFLAVAMKCVDENGNYGGYFQLGANITYNTNFAETMSKPDLCPTMYAPAFKYAENGPAFVGIFDGKSYIIDGLLTFDQGSFIPKIGEAGILKNIIFTNAMVGSNSAMICGANFGLIENIYVDVYVFGLYYSAKYSMLKYYNPGHTGANTGFFNNEWSCTGTIRNVVIDMTNSAKKTYIEGGDHTKAYGESWHDDYGMNPAFASETAYADKFYGLGKGQTAKYEGVYLIGMPETAQVNERNWFTKDEMKVYIYASMEAFEAAYYDASGIVKEQLSDMPKLIKAYAIPATDTGLPNARTVDLNLQYVNGELVSGNDATASASIRICSGSHGSSTHWNVFYNGVRLTYGSDKDYTTSGSGYVYIKYSVFGTAFGEDELIVVTSLGKYRVPILLISNVIYNAEDLDNMNYVAEALGGSKGVYDGYFQLGGNIEYNKEYIPMMDASASGRALKYTELESVVADADGYATYNGRYLLCDSKLVKAADLANAVASGSNTTLNDKTVYVLNCTSKYALGWNATAGTGFVGTFDGAGYYINGMQIGNDINYAAFMPKMGSTAVIKNVAFINATYTNNGTVGGFLNMIGNDGALVENVYIQITSFGGGYASATALTDNNRGLSGITLRNVLIDTTAATANSIHCAVLGGTSSNDKNEDGVADTYVIYDGAYALVNNENQYNNYYGAGAIDADSKDYGVFYNMAGLLADSAAAAEVASWATPENYFWKYVPEEGYFGWHSLYVAPEKPDDGGKGDGGR